MSIDILINALLKSMGFDREKFDAQLVVYKTELEEFSRRAQRSEARLIEVNERLINIEAALTLLAANTQNEYKPGEPHFADHPQLER